MHRKTTLYTHSFIQRVTSQELHLFANPTPEAFGCWATYIVIFTHGTEYYSHCISLQLQSRPPKSSLPLMTTHACNGLVFMVYRVVNVSFSHPRPNLNPKSEALKPVNPKPKTLTRNHQNPSFLVSIFFSMTPI